MAKILIIEDADSIRELITEILMNEGFQAIAASNGQQGLQLANTEFPDLIICDIMMPGLDGYGVLEQLRQNPKTVIIPFIFLTAKSGKKDLREGMQLGADDYLTKPFTEDELLNSVRSRLEHSQLLESSYNRQLQQFCSNITLALPHELRTPLTGIMGSVGFLLAQLESLSKPEIKEMLEYINVSSQRLYELIQRYLLYIRLETIASNENTIANSRQQSTSLITEIIEAVAYEKAETLQRLQDLSLSLIDCSEALKIQIDCQDYQQLITELIDNAFKFSDRQTPVIVSIAIDSQNLQLSIKNQGRGMTPEQIMNIGAFNQFQRQQYEQQGMGLGLAIAQKIVTIYQGQLLIESEPNQEILVTVILPLSKI